MMESACWHFRVRRQDIAFLRFVVEACDGIAFLRTVDPVRGEVVLHIPPGCESEAAELVTGLRSVMLLEGMTPAERSSL